MIFFLQVKLYKLLVFSSRILLRLIPIPNPILFTGKNSSLDLCDAIAHRGHRHVLLVTDQTLIDLKLADKILLRLTENNINCTVYNEVLPDPTSYQIENGSVVAKHNNCDAIIGFGGGSSLDAAKAIAACVTNLTTSKQLAGLFKIKKIPLPLYLIPTTAGTGSEATFASVISDDETHAKSFLMDPKLVPIMAALDGQLMLNLPSNITAATGMDALTHAIEAYISTNANKTTNELALSAIRLILNNLETAVTNNGDFQVRQNMAMASYYAGAAFTRAGVGYVHAISHNIGAAYGTPHGVANAMILPRVLEYSFTDIVNRLATIARTCHLINHEVSDVEAARTFIQQVETMLSIFDIPYYLNDLQKDHIPKLAKAALREAHLTPYAVPKYMTQNDCENMLRSMLKP